jgi:hypothetical protein
MKPIEKYFSKSIYYRIVLNKDGYSGRVFVHKQGGPIISETDLDELKHELEREVLRSSPIYFGFDGAKQRFLRVCQQGFQSPNYLRERSDKAEAKAMLDEFVPLSTALHSTGSGKDILRVIQHTELVSPIEKARMAAVLKGGHADNFVQGAALFASGNIGSGLKQMKESLKSESAATWPAVTYLPFLWRPDAHMFLKPEVTKEYAERVGHPFSLGYSSELTPIVYDQLLDLAQQTEKHIADLNPADRIDIQGFIWVVNRYKEESAAIPPN